jgi:transposase
MPKALSDDLRCPILEAYARKEGSQAQLARRFAGSFEPVRKLRKQFRQAGQMERRPQSPHNMESRMTAAVREQLRVWSREQPDRTLAESGEQLEAQSVQASRSLIWLTLRQMGLRQKKVAPRPGTRPQPEPPAARRVPRPSGRDPAGEA